MSGTAYSKNFLDFDIVDLKLKDNVKVQNIYGRMFDVPAVSPEKNIPEFCAKITPSGENYTIQ